MSTLFTEIGHFNSLHLERCQKRLRWKNLIASGTKVIFNRGPEGREVSPAQGCAFGEPAHWLQPISSTSSPEAHKKAANEKEKEAQIMSNPESIESLLALE